MSKITIEQIKYSNTEVFIGSDGDVMIGNPAGFNAFVEKQNIPALISALDPERDKRIQELEFLLAEKEAAIVLSFNAAKRRGEKNKFLQSQLEDVEKAKIRGDRKIVELEHEKTVLRSQLEEANKLLIHLKESHAFSESIARKVDRFTSKLNTKQP